MGNVSSGDKVAFALISTIKSVCFSFFHFFFLHIFHFFWKRVPAAILFLFSMG